MTEDRKKKIEESAEEIVDSFSDIAEGLPEQEETYYQQSTVNVLRSDDTPTPREELDEFRKRFIRIIPESDDDGSLIVEVAEWTE